MSHSYLQQYRTFDELMESVRVDLPIQANEDQIRPEQLIKVVQLVNHDLGLRIQQEKEAVIEIENHKARLPEDFHILNFALLLGSFRVETPVIHGRHTEERIIEPEPDEVLTTTPSCSSCRPVKLTECGTTYQVVETFKPNEVRIYEHFFPLKIGSSKFVGKQCINLGHSGPNHATIRDGFIFTNFESGKIYLHYLGDMVDEDGNLLVADHPRLNEYYEYKVKQRIFENLRMRNEPVDAQMQIVEMRLRDARNNALSYVNTPDFAEMRELWEMNRKAQYQKYFYMFR